MNNYQNLRSRHQKEFDEFPIVFAFSNKQFAEAMAKLGLTIKDTGKIISLGSGGFILKTDSDAFESMVERHKKEMDAAIASDSTGEGFIFDMFDIELGNHEYCITYDLTDALDTLDLTLDQVKADERLLNGINMAIRAQEVEL